VSYGHNVQVGYYDQTLGDLNPKGNVIDEIWNLDHSQTEEQVRSYLARFSFFDDDVYKKTRDLSGGEKGRLALAKIMYTGGNLVERFKSGTLIPNVAPPPAAQVALPRRPAAEGGGATQKKRDNKRIKKIDDEMAQLEERIAAAERDRERNDQLLCTEEVFRDG